MPRGGFRVGAGRKKKTPEERFLDGNAGHRGRVLSHPSSPAIQNQESGTAEEFGPSERMTAEERAVWERQAPFAFANRTLTKASAMAFERYCRLVVEEEIEGRSSGHGGSNHRGMVKTLNAYELQFGLTPGGKAMTAPKAEQPAQPEQKRAYW